MFMSCIRRFRCGRVDGLLFRLVRFFLNLLGFYRGGGNRIYRHHGSLLYRYLVGDSVYGSRRLLVFDRSCRTQCHVCPHAGGKQQQADDDTPKNTIPAFFGLFRLSRNLLRRLGRIALPAIILGCTVEYGQRYFHYPLAMRTPALYGLTFSSLDNELGSAIIARYLIFHNSIFANTFLVAPDRLSTNDDAACLLSSN